MAKKELKTETKRLRLTKSEAEQLDKYLADNKINFSDLVNGFLSEKVMSKVPTVSESKINEAKKKTVVKQPPKVDPALLFQIGKIGNNLNQVAKSLNTIYKDPTAISKFSFLECFHVLSQMQNDLHQYLGELPKIERSPEAVKKARERAMAKRRVDEDVH